MSAGYRFFLTFCVTLCILTVLSVVFVSFVYRPEIGETMLSGIRDKLASGGEGTIYDLGDGTVAKLAEKYGLSDCVID